MNALLTKAGAALRAGSSYLSLARALSLIAAAIFVPISLAAVHAPAEAGFLKQWKTIPCFFDSSWWPENFHHNNMCYLQGRAPQTPDYMSPAVKTEAIVYASQFYGSSILIYAQNAAPNAAPIGLISNGLKSPQGIFVSHNHDLYVANTIDQNILVFHKGDLTAYRTLNDPGQYPTDVAVDSDGTVYAANIFDSNGVAGSITVFAPGVNTPTRVLNLPHAGKVISCALDANHDLYVGYSYPSPSNDIRWDSALVEYINGVGKAQSTSIMPDFPGEMRFDAANHLIAADQGMPPVAFLGAYVFFVPSNQRAAVFGKTEGDPLGVALTRDQRHLYLGDAFLGTLNEYDYTTGKLLNSFTNKNDLFIGDPAYGVAVDPAPAL